MLVYLFLYLFLVEFQKSSKRGWIYDARWFSHSPITVFNQSEWNVCLGDSILFRLYRLKALKNGTSRRFKTPGNTSYPH